MFLLRSFVNERLTTAIEEILGVVEHTVADYENEVSRLKKEVRCLRGQLDILQPVIKIPRADIRQITGPESEEKGPPEWYHYEQVPGPSLDREDGEPIQTKVELQNPEEQEDSMATLIKEEEEHLDINELPEGGVIKLVLPLCPVSGISGFYPVLTPDCTPARSGNSGKNSVARKGPRSGSNKQKSRRTQGVSHVNRKEVKPMEVRFLNAPINHGGNHHCKMCGRFYLTPSALKKHIRVHIQEAQPLCGVCEQQFQSIEHLIDHLATHTGAKYCNICGKCFDKDMDLNAHIDGHTGEKQFKCHICVKSFGRKENLALHIRTHTGEKPFHCTLCGKGFSQKPNLKVHMRIHTGEKPYYCHVCYKRFHYKQQFTLHMIKHT